MAANGATNAAAAANLAQLETGAAAASGRLLGAQQSEAAGTSADEEAAAQLALHEAELNSPSWSTTQERKLTVAAGRPSSSDPVTAVGAPPRFGTAEWNGGEWNRQRELKRDAAGPTESQAGSGGACRRQRRPDAM